MQDRPRSPLCGFELKDELLYILRAFPMSAVTRSPLVDLPVDQHPHASALQRILSEGALQAVFQPIVDLSHGQLIGVEGLIRGPSDSPLQAPAMLFSAAEACQCELALDLLCQRTVVERYAALQLNRSRLFLNVNPVSLLESGFKPGKILSFLESVGLQAHDIVIEITECYRLLDYSVLKSAALAYRNMGFSIALDDLGEGSSSLRLWSELRPDFVKIDKHFIQNLHLDPVKQQFVRSIQQIAENARSQVIAEGVETLPELQMVKSFGIAYGQGYLFAQPQPVPSLALSADVRQQLGARTRLRRNHAVGSVAADIIYHVTSIGSDTSNEHVLEMFANSATLQALPVVDNGAPVGLLKRQQVLERFAKPFSRELIGRKPCSLIMDRQPMIVDAKLSLQELSRLVAYAERHYLTDGFIVAQEGRYLGMASGYDLMRALADQRLNEARYANPLTLLPGNVPINEQIEYFLEQESCFAACFVDINHFKPFNDCYGYRLGDEVIQLLGRILQEVTDPTLDFVGHVGGDDFVVLFRSEDWQARCDLLLTHFSERSQRFHAVEHIRNNGYTTENRRGEREFHPLLSVAIGAVLVSPSNWQSHHEVAVAMADAKRMAKRAENGALFIERRQRS